MFHYVATIDGVKYYTDSRTVLDTSTIAGDAVIKSGITTNRFNPKTCWVVVEELSINLGKLEAKLLREIEVTPPYAPITEKEYDQEMAKILEAVPKAFHACIRYLAWSQGHSAGFEEILSIASTIVTEFSPAIKAFGDEVKKEVRNFYQ